MTDDGDSRDELGAIEATQLLLSVLSPHVFEDVRKLEQGETDLVHYTTAENAINILQGREFWLRSVRTMNDFMEVEHGIGLLLKAFGGPENENVERLCGILDQLHEGAARHGINVFNEWLPRLPDITYIGCLSLAESSETRGRLSMWRGYSAPSAGVCIVMNKTPFLAESNELKAYSVPVAYMTDTEFLDGIRRCIDAVETSIEQLQDLSYEDIANTIFWWLLALSVSLKHPGFYEEREWRVIYFPEMEKSEVIEEAVASVRGIPQIVQKIPLKDDADAGLHGASPNSLIKKLIIGPTEFASTIRAALIRQMKDAGVEGPESKVFISDIPLR